MSVFVEGGEQGNLGENLQSKDEKQLQSQPTNDFRYGIRIQDPPEGGDPSQ